MQILATGDYHGRADALDSLREFISPIYDLVLIDGDLGHLPPDDIDLTEVGTERREAIENRLYDPGVPPAERARSVYDILTEHDCPVLAVPGNSDTEAVRDVMAERGTDLHGVLVSHGELTVAGFGGVTEFPLPVDLPFRYTADEQSSRLTSLATDSDSPWILLTHEPPHNSTLDVTTDGEHVGSTGVRQTIAEGQPVVAVCGHIHEARGIDQIGATTVVNPGPLMEGYAADIVIEDGSVDVTLLTR